MNENMIATCGVFDIIHVDHINLFKRMKFYAGGSCDPPYEVTIFLNSDESVIANRGKPPLVCQEQRLEVLESIRYVKVVYYFNEKHPHVLIKRFKPAIWAKGGDYDVGKMQSTPIVQAYGGKVISIKHKYFVHSSDIKQRCYNEIREDIKADE